MTRITRLPIHPFLAAAYPVLALLASNIGQVRPSIAWRPLLFSVVAAAVVFATTRILLGSWSRAALITTWLVILFYSYGHAYNTLSSVQVFQTTLGRHRFLVPLWTLLAAGGGYLIVGLQQKSTQVDRALNLGLLVALILPILGIVQFQIDQGRTASEIAEARTAAAGDVPAIERARPDIYYIILDAYAREDTLAESFAYDNSPFLDWLEDRGFTVAACSQANYSQSELSMTTSLNFQYLEDLVPGALEGEEDRVRLRPYLRQPRVRHLFEDLGYEIVAFETGYYWSEWEDADLYLQPGDGPFRGLTAFEATLLRSTAAWAGIDILPTMPDYLSIEVRRAADYHRQRVRFVLDSLSTLAAREGPQFVFAHIVSPHRPFVYDAEGNPVDDDYRWGHEEVGPAVYAEGYRQQLTFLNRELMKVLNDIVERSDEPPVIILQSDHGPEEGSSADRMRILNAYYLPGNADRDIYPEISPVNSFRVVLKEVFGAGYDYLPDRSYFSTYQDPFDYSVVQSDCEHSRLRQP